MNGGRVMVIQAYAILLPRDDTVQFFAQRLIIRCVKIQAAYGILSIHSMAVRLHDIPKPLPQDDQIPFADFMFYFMPKLQPASSPFDFTK